MKIGVGVSWEIVVDGEIDLFDIDTSAKDIGCNTDALVEVFELLVALDTTIELATI